MTPLRTPPPMDAYAQRLHALIVENTPRLVSIPADRTAIRPAPDKWCAREILGHLIDSASNNHRRFVLGQLQDSIAFEGYGQDRWVSVQRYQEADWPELVALWRSLNLHLARLMEVASEGERTRPRAEHNLERIAARPLPDGQPATLGYLMADYVDHLEHHLKQILGDRFADATDRR